jgi:hypothetical protein
MHMGAKKTLATKEKKIKIFHYRRREELQFSSFLVPSPPPPLFPSYNTVVTVCLLSKFAFCRDLWNEVFSSHLGFNSPYSFSEVLFITKL